MVGIVRATDGKLKCLKCGFFVVKDEFHLFDSGYRSRTCDGCRSSKKMRKSQREEGYGNSVSESQKKVKDLLGRVW